MEARKTGDKAKLEKIWPSSSVLSIKSPVHETVHTTCIPFFFNFCHITYKLYLGKACRFMRNTDILIIEHLSIIIVVSQK